MSFQITQQQARMAEQSQADLGATMADLGAAMAAMRVDEGADYRLLVEGEEGVETQTLKGQGLGSF